ncbi:unnamed protein product [Prorocentrum cordatum]|uniref:Dirigent protein n=1 Tax=Prorocentrum cordatum TaxID=2364126 RepID=A0ABN9UVL3_9DINO|nr:unnamed protein product [Polarella glacialis]
MATAISPGSPVRRPAISVTPSVPTGVSLPSGLPIRSPRTISPPLRRTSLPPSRPAYPGGPARRAAPSRRSARSLVLAAAQLRARRARRVADAAEQGPLRGPERTRFFFLYDNVQVDAAGYYVLSAPRREATRATRGRPLLRRQAPPPR